MRKKAISSRIAAANRVTNHLSPTGALGAYHAIMLGQSRCPSAWALGHRRGRFLVGLTSSLPFLPPSTLLTGDTCVEIINRVFANRHERSATAAEQSDLDDCDEAMGERP